MPPDDPNVLSALLEQFDAEAENETPLESEPEEEVAAGRVSVEPPPDEGADGDDEQEDDAPESEPDQEEEQEEEPDQEEEEEGEEHEEEDVTAGEDPEVAAFLAKYGGDEQKALKAGSELARLLGRRDREKEQLAARNAQLEAALAEAQAFASGTMPLNAEAQAWVEQAAASPNPSLYVRQALEQGEYGLARAVCREWAHEDPYEAGRLGQYVDLAEYQAGQTEEPPVTATTEQIISALANELPEMTSYFDAMARITRQLGADHPLVLESRSNNPEEAMRGMIGIYEIARASTATVAEAKSEIRKRQRREADDERRRGVVTSAANSPSSTETPRTREIMPGLTLEDLDTEFARS